MVAKLARKEAVENASKTRLKLWISMIRTSNYIETEIRDRLRCKYKVTLPRFDVMAALYRHDEGMMMSQLSRVLMVSNGNVTGIVDRLVKDGMVIRSQRDGDRRTWIIALTGPGSSFFKKMADEHEQWIDELLIGCSIKQAEIFQAGYKEIANEWDDWQVKND